MDRVPEVVPDYPDRIVPKPEHVAELKKRTLINLYNQRPTWLDNAHKALDAAVAAAYGWEDYNPLMSDDNILGRLLALYLERAGRLSVGRHPYIIAIVFLVRHDQKPSMSFICHR